MTTRFGFDDAGVGFDQAPFASIYADIEVQAGKTLPAFSASVTLSKDRRLHVETTASATFTAFSATAIVQTRAAAPQELTADKTFARVHIHGERPNASAEPPHGRGCGNLPSVHRNRNAIPAHPRYIARSTINRRYGRIRRD